VNAIEGRATKYILCSLFYMWVSQFVLLLIIENGAIALNAIHPQMCQGSELTVSLHYGCGGILNTQSPFCVTRCGIGCPGLDSV